MPLSDSDLEAVLDATLLTGAVLTDRASNLGNLRRLAAREPAHLYGVDVAEHWTLESLLALMGERVGISTDPSFESGQDRIDARLTVERLARYRDRFSSAVRQGALLLFATAHPATLMDVYRRFASAATAAGARVLDVNALPFASPDGIRVPLADKHQALWCTGGVTCAYRGGSLLHTHSPEPMDALLVRLDELGIRPDLVIADHGWAGAAGRRGFPVLAIADCNDPAVFVAEAQGSIEVVVPLDDGLAVHLYDPVIDYVVAGVSEPARTSGS
ncbi:phosphatase [Rathayibacter iranicus]|uniref:Taurine ABC transporter ATPase n=2 Tax=Rathayibacter iranicus TaxID=59737 RepID=A0AAD1AER8_9MICO|nr:phosphatase [Rathayibacter iranicus]AZZ57032.1 taurine ABC transporter ATPase [Rathayibacter iranicus]MWV29647.1 taurine ABC transporter ATPase [Rathayibacter iranicus NCPPB 2253 = VKM Ac-1602]PPI41808.1 taurine ABC transporter ATPase [Rathayibacter iranicus]PPI57698.1 taurine ABC transporter ATPase [Rathayibacter iranicus]PPI68500.1 taurine ABC transporter ATPase [Rathayibacter iranicus]